MLNRRSLRIKAMQTIYAFKQSKESDYYIALDLIKQTFLPDLNSMEVQDKEALDKNKNQAMTLFQTYYQTDEIKVEKGIAEEVHQAASDALAYYKRLVDKDIELYKKQMLAETEKIYDHYIYMLLLFSEWAELSKVDSEKKSYDTARSVPVGSLNFSRNVIVERLVNSRAVSTEAIKRNIDWAKNRGNVRQWFKDIVKKDPLYQDYLTIKEPSFEEDKKLLLHIAKNIIFKNEGLQAFWEENDLRWAENKAILKSMVVKTIKTITEDGLDADPELVTLSTNWEDDKEFFVQLFSKCIKNNEQYETLISKKAQNWDVERIAATDKVILSLALCEMMSFPSIPVKVTINEYIDISKVYSTPKSKQFVNGILDVLADELQKEGLIRKSGRGLIDNK